MMRRPTCGFLALAALTATAFAVPAHAADTNLVTNGGFDITSSTTPSELGLNGYTVTGWTNNNNGYNFIFDPTLTGTSSVSGQAAGNTSLSQYTGGQGNASFSVWTSQNGGLATDPSTLLSPAGGNVLAADGAFQVGSISQSISNLTVGESYLLSFYWAAGQQYSYTGATTEMWGVTFGNSTYNTPTVTTASKGFTPWTLASVYFVASAATQTLSFLAAGTPSGQPPLSLLDGVSLVAAPEPATWAVLTIGVVGSIAFASRRRRLRANLMA